MTIPPEPFNSGDPFGPYELIRPLGRGSFAEVWLAEHKHLHSKHAIKCLHPDWCANQRLRDRFLAEGRILAQLQHPGLVRVTDVLFSDQTHVGLVMEYLQGRDLGSVLAQGAMPVDKALPILRQLLEAIGYAHEHGIIHRDLKPENVILVGPEASPRPVLLDFGIAKFLEDTGVIHQNARATRARARLGTPQYMSPEQIESSAAVDARSDLFAVGAIAYEMVTGVSAFDGDGITEIMYRVTRGEHRSLDALPTSLQPAIRTALQVDRDLRFADHHAFLAALPATVDAAPPPRSSSAPRPPKTPKDTSTLAEFGPPQRTPRRWLFPFLGLLAAAGLALGLYFQPTSELAPEVSVPSEQPAEVLAANEPPASPQNSDETLALPYDDGLSEEPSSVPTPEEDTPAPTTAPRSSPQTNPKTNPKPARRPRPNTRPDNPAPSYDSRVDGAMNRATNKAKKCPGKRGLEWSVQVLFNTDGTPKSVQVRSTGNPRNEVRSCVRQAFTPLNIGRLPTPVAKKVKFTL